MIIDFLLKLVKFFWILFPNGRSLLKLIFGNKCCRNLLYATILADSLTFCCLLPNNYKDSSLSIHKSSEILLLKLFMLLDSSSNRKT